MMLKRMTKAKKLSHIFILDECTLNLYQGMSGCLLANASLSEYSP